MRFQVRYEFFKRSFPLSDYGGDIPTAKKVALKFKELSDKMALQFDVRKGKASRHGSDGVQLSIYIYISRCANTIIHTLYRKICLYMYIHFNCSFMFFPGAEFLATKQWCPRSKEKISEPETN